MKMAEGAYFEASLKLSEIRDKTGAAKVKRVKINEAIIKIFGLFICLIISQNRLKININLKEKMV